MNHAIKETGLSFTTDAVLAVPTRNSEVRLFELDKGTMTALPSRSSKPVEPAASSQARPISTGWSAGSTSLPRCQHGEGQDVGHNDRAAFHMGVQALGDRRRGRSGVLAHGASLSARTL
ncbi:hypothetical protein AQJ84_02925 [Streptomyces resistomycificus]|nr:hypothetical protein AQJ84_02925 [Streptomyces resistomycificus]